MLTIPARKAPLVRCALSWALVLPALAGCGRRAVLPYDVEALAGIDRCERPVLGVCLSPPPPILPYDEGVLRMDLVRPRPAARVAPPVRIVVSLPQQRLFAYRDGVLATTSPVSTGKPGHATPTGIFHISQKQVFHRSNRYSNAPMPYMQRLTASGIALHAGRLPGYPASHGCIRLPMATAKRLYRMTSMGTPVVVTRAAVAASGGKHHRRGRHRTGR